MKYKKLSIIIPVYNEVRTIKKLITKVLNSKIALKKEIIIVDDASNDGTVDILKKIKNNKIKIIFHKKNQGKGAALRTGFKNISGDISIIQDADLEYDPNEYSKLIDLILKGKTQVVYGSRFMKKSRTKKSKWAIPIHYLGNKALSFITSLLFFRYISDMETCYKCMTREVYSKLIINENDFRVEPEITTQIIKKGYKITEIPIKYNSRDFKQGKKINWKDGVKAFLALIKFRFVD